MESRTNNKTSFEFSVNQKDIFCMDSNTLMDSIRNAVKNRDNIEEPEYVVSMDLNEGIPYKIYKSNKKEYFDEFCNN